MKANMFKVILKTVVTAAMVATVFIGGDKMTVKADDVDDFCAIKGISIDEFGERLLIDEALTKEYWEYCNEGENFEDAMAQVVAELESMGFFNGPTLADITSAKNDMLSKVNKDRQKNGAGKLAWDVDLEMIARQRAIDVMSNVQTPEFEEARVNGDTAKLNEIIHKGHTLMENAIVSSTSGVTTKTANTNWINSAGHHAQRINAGWTKYACASYTDPFTGMETWVEVFADDTYSNGPDFDHMRYAAENPDVAAVFGEDSGALYHHYITCGKAEGRSGYSTDGTALK